MSSATEGGAAGAPLFSDRPDGRPLVIAHRGAPLRAPENTLRAFQIAVEEGADGIELDVQLSRDGVPVVMHDASVDRTTTGTGRVSDLTAAELRALVIPARGGGEERVPTLADVLAAVGPTVFLDIELKAPSPAADSARQALIEAALAALGEAGWTTERFFISSFDHELLRQLSERRPDVAVAPLVHRRRPAVHDLPGRIINPHHELVTPDWAAEIKRSGRQLFPWTANAATEWEAMCRAGVSGVITDDPAGLRRWLERSV
ncbi:MAG TPA: glycerophosphodiester phosphodiesterase family protein [Limnochordia bacterium]